MQDQIFIMPGDPNERCRAAEECAGEASILSVL